MSAIHIAAANGDLATVTRLQSAGVELDSPDKDGLTPLHWASYRGHVGTVRFLLENGALVEGRNRRAYSPLMVASREGWTDVVILLLQHGANPNRKDETGLSAVFYAAGYDRKEGVLKELLRNGGTANAVADGTMASPLMWAAGAGIVDNVKTLIEHRADVGVVDSNGRTALDWARDKGHSEIADLIARCVSRNGSGPG